MPRAALGDHPQSIAIRDICTAGAFTHLDNLQLGRYLLIVQIAERTAKYDGPGACMTHGKSATSNRRLGRNGFLCTTVRLQS